MLNFKRPKTHPSKDGMQEVSHNQPRTLAMGECSTVFFVVRYERVGCLAISIFSNSIVQ